SAREPWVEERLGASASRVTPTVGARREQFEERLRADDRHLVGEGMEGLNGEASGKRVDPDVAQRRGREAVGGFEAVKDPIAGRVDDHLFAEMPEDLRIDPFDLEANLVVHQAR